MYCSRLETCDISDLIALAENKKRCCILILDQVTDPQNIGAIIRSCAAFETLGLIVQDKNSPLESGAMDKAAAGTVEFVPVARVTNLSRAIETLKENGFWVIGMDGYADTTIDKSIRTAKSPLLWDPKAKACAVLFRKTAIRPSNSLYRRRWKA